MRRTLGFALIVLASSALAAAQATSTTRLIPFSGTAADVTGLPLRSQATAVFELYEEQEGGAPLWRETHRVAPDERGRYLVYLGSVTPIPQVAFTEERARWLAVTVEGRTLPRVMLVAVPYALRAADADTLGGQPASSFVRSRAADSQLDTSAGMTSASVDGSGTAGQLAKFIGATNVGSSIVTETSANQIGIGTADPTEGGLLSSKVTIRATDGTTALAVSNQAGLPRFALNTNSDGSWITYDRASGSYLPGIAQRGGRVGIATTDPTGGGVVDSKFTVQNLDNNTGIAVLNQLNQRRFALNTGSNGSWTLYDGANGTWNSGLAQQGGNVKIGFANINQTGRLSVEATTQSGGVGVYTSSSNGPALIASSGVSGAPAIQADGSIGIRVFAFNRGLDVKANLAGGTAIWAEGLNGATAGTFLGSVLMASDTGTALGVIGGISTSSVANNTPLQVSNGTGTAVQVDTPTGSTIFLGRRDGNNVFRISAAGQVFAAGYTTGGADFAEEIEPAENHDRYEPGDVLTIGLDRDRTVVISQFPYATAVLGVYSTQPGITASPYSMDDPRREGKLPVAMIGIVPCKVSTENGAIHRGDLLVTSATPGHAMKATDRARMTGAIVGKALEPLASGTGKILVAVTLQ